MAKNIRLDFNKNDLGKWLQDNNDVKDFTMKIAEQVRTEAARTASEAEKGPGGKLTGYASAGFKTEYDKRSKRPVAKIISNADGQMATRVHLSTQRRNGVGHMRAALYSFTTTKKVKRVTG
jgi:hypothetical protein